MIRLRFGITAATVAYLAWISGVTLGPLVAPAPDSAMVVLEALEKPGLNSSTESHSLWIKAIVADGRLLRWDSADRSAGWEVKSVRDTLPVLSYAPGSKPAALAFRARHFIASLQSREWSGVMRVKRGGRTVQLVDIQAPGGEDFSLHFGDPPPSRPGSLFFGAMVFFGVCAWCFGPMRRGRTATPWLVFFLCIVHILYWASMPIGTTNDSMAYRDAIPALFSAGVPTFFPPGYPAFLAAVAAVGGSALGTCTTLAQHGMVILAAVWLYLLLRRFISEDLALLAALLAGSLAPALTVPQAAISETATAFAMLGALYYSLRSVETGNLLFGSLAGGLVGWAAILRGVPLAAVLPAVALICLSPGARKGKRVFAAAAAVAVAILLLPISWFWYRSGQAQLTNSLGFHLFNRVFREQKQVDRDGPATRKLFTLVAGQDPRDLHHWEVREIGGLRNLNEAQQELLLRQASLEGIAKNPGSFVAYTLQLAWRSLVAPTAWVPAWAEAASPEMDFENARPLPVTDSGLAWRGNLESLQKILWPVLCWLAVAGVLLGLLSRRRLLILACAAVPIGYMLLTACVEEFCPRYNAPLLPFIAALAMLPAELARRLLQKWPFRLPVWHEHGALSRAPKGIAADGSA